MPVTNTPLRYPGGKSQLVPLVIDLMRKNGLFYGHYAEPFAGGAGIAMTLLLDGYVDHLYLNDFDPAIFALWTSILDHTDEICELIFSTNVSIEEWHRQRAIYFSTARVGIVEKGFATLFLNRTNRSGIIKAGVIGGLNQNGNYKIDCRFMKPDLIRKIRRIAACREQISLSQLDAVDFLQQVIPQTPPLTLVNLDPPYFGKGPDLYTNFYKHDDHAALAQQVYELDRSWMVTYDDTPEIRELYARFPIYSSSLNYSAQTKRVGTELLVLAPGLEVPQGLIEMPIEA
ncbi:DNA methyltransferase [Janthinobacterium lividum]|uniref:site-specific DNA-methyltransferase (adenine-specific) n=1 Tax=Janthinobacterium lividum TaxID=29581 RepID=A0A1S1UDL2_9BURK|nr:DNA adenine methylase [Janthinobacterium lividum]OHV98507.1 DNA methyltransferase [Janthinobacterium lividum]